jgi:hypothetical protein
VATASALYQIIWFLDAGYVRAMRKRQESPLASKDSNFVSPESPFASEELATKQLASKQLASKLSKDISSDASPRESKRVAATRMDDEDVGTKVSFQAA